MQHIRKRLEDELHTLDHELRTELPREIKTAVALGDLRENAEYKAALERQSYVRLRMGQLQQRLMELSRMNLNAIPRDSAHLGSLIKVLDLDSNKEMVYELVIPEDTDATVGKISPASPIGKGLVGKKPGDEVTITIPSGSRTFEIISLETMHDRKSGDTTDGA